MVSADFQQIQQALRAAYVGDEVYEVRILSHVPGRTDSGYFNDATVAANTVVNSDSNGRQGTYSTLNPVNPALHARAYNIIMPGARNLLTHDNDILYRHRLLVDIDPKRPSGISSTDAEKQLAYFKADKLCTTMMTLHGWPAPMLVDSGNGYHLIWMTERLDNSELYTDLFKNTLKALALRFDDESVQIDRANFNASRIVRVPGTVARKGSDRPDRPHRLSRIIKPYDGLGILTASHMATVAQKAVEADKSALSAGRTPRSYPADEGSYRALNTVARASIDRWVPALFEHINPQRLPGGGYRIESAQLGRNLQEDLSITAEGGIKDFGLHDMGDAREGHRTPVELVAEHRTGGDKRAAAEWLSQIVGVPLVEFDALLSDPVPPPEAQDISDLTGGVTTEEAFKVKTWYQIEQEGKVSRPPLIPMLLGPGGTIMSGPPKSGKTYLALQVAVGLCMGVSVLGQTALAPMEVLYIALEDEAPNMRMRAQYIMVGLAEDNKIPVTSEYAKTIQDRLHISSDDMYEDSLTKIEQRVKGSRSFRKIQEILKSNNRIRLTIIDPFFLFKDEPGRDNLITDEYKNIANISRFFRHEGVDFLIVHHNRKAGRNTETEDMIEAINGTTAISAAFPNTTILSRPGERGAASDAIFIQSKMRSVLDGNYEYYARKRDNGAGFTMISNEENMEPTGEELESVLRELRFGAAQGPMNLNNLQTLTRLRKDRLLRALTRLIQDKMAEQVGNGYVVSGTQISTPKGGGKTNSPIKAIMLEIINDWTDVTYKKQDLFDVVLKKLAEQGLGASTGSLSNYLSELVMNGTVVNIGRGMYRTVPKGLPDVL